MSAPGLLTAGRYRLVQRLENPALDRRRASDWRLVTRVFEAGTEFHLNEYRGIDGRGDLLGFEITLRKGRYTHQNLMCLPNRSDAWGSSDKITKLAKALVPLLERVDDETEVETPLTRQAREIHTLQTALGRISRIGAEDGLTADEYRQRLIAAIGYAQAATPKTAGALE